MQSTQLLLLLLSAAVACSFAAVIPRHNGDQVIVFVPTNLDQVKWLVDRHNEEGEKGKLGEFVKFWFGPSRTHRQSIVYVPNSVQEKFVAAIPRYASKWWIVQQENLGKLVEIERRTNVRNRAMHTRYMRYQEITEYLWNKASSCGSVCELEAIGRSTENRQLLVMKIGDNNPSKRIIWIDAGFHAREWIAPATGIYFIDKLIDGYNSNDATIRALLQDFTIYIAPLMNPDGYEYTFTNSRYWRKTRSVQSFGCRGVDPNRNFGYMWGGKGTSGSPCSDIYRGPSAFSEPETKALRDELLQLASRTISYITVHSYGQMWMTPYGYDYNVDSSSSPKMMRAIRAAANKLDSLGKKYKIGNSATVIYPAAGASDDWAHSIGIPYAHTIELPDTGRYGFNLPADQIQRVGLETLQALLEYLKVVQAENVKKN